MNILNPDRVIVIVMDGCGAGPAPDADQFGDSGPEAGNTLVNVAAAAGGLKIPTLRVLGLGNALPLAGAEPHARPIGSFGRLTPMSQGGKDTVTGHWEMMGIVVDQRFPTYPNGFPQEVIEPFTRAIGTGVLGNYPASGTEIIKQLGAEHMRTGKPIVYTSADSVFQIAAHEDVVPIERLYEICQTARRQLTGQHSVQRVIARPFDGAGPEDFKRTDRRRDFPLTPPPNVLDRLAEKGLNICGIGVIPEVFDGRGFTTTERTQTNEEHFEAVVRALDTETDFIFANFEDFDMRWGHRNDVPGFAKGLEQFDNYLKTIMGELDSRDLLIITADHGNDPTTPGTDHNRELAPLLVYSPSLPGGVDFGTRSTFADIGATIAKLLEVDAPPVGESLL